MGDIADYYRDLEEEWNYEHGLTTKPKSSEEFIWVTSDRKEIRVGNMTDLHVKNALNAIKSGRIYYNQEDVEEKAIWIKIFENEIKRRKL